MKKKCTFAHTFKQIIKNMKRTISALILLFSVLTIMAQFQNPIHFTTSQKQVKPGVVEVAFSATIDEGWHVYGCDIPDGGPTKAEVVLESCSGAKKQGDLLAKGNIQTINDPMFGMKVSIIEEKVTFVQTFVLTDSKYHIEGYLTYGACDDHSCLPPSDVAFSFDGDNLASALSEPATQNEIPSEQETATDTINPILSSDSVPSTFNTNLWEPVIDQLKAFDQASSSDGNTNLLTILLLGMLGGLFALLTPCVWPIIPMTVSFFLKRSKDNHAKGIWDAITYGISIVVIYVSLGLLVTMIFGASALNSLSTNAVFNLLFFLMLIVFGLSFLGGFEITLPASWTNAVDGKAEKTTGLLSIFLMAFTLSLVSFSCTGPIIGFLLVEVGTTGDILAPTVGMFGFALALALPFTLFALFPTWLKSAPRSGNWMNCIKVCLGFLELAFALKFLSVADLAYGWRILDREVFLCLWIVIFGMMGAYLLHWIRLPHDEDEYDDEGNVIQNPKTSIPRMACGMGVLAFALYMIPGLWGAPCKAVSAFAPPMNTQSFNLCENGEVKPRFEDYEAGMKYAQEHNMPVMLDFTGFGCVNCRKMEAAVWTDSRVADIINNRFVLITLHVDDKTPLPQPVVITENGQERKLRTIGDRWSYLQRLKFGANAQPFYVLIDASGNPLASSYSYNEDIPAYINWLESAL